MNPQERFRRIDGLFRAACALPAGAREEWLARECECETSILGHVRHLLTLDGQNGLLDRPALMSVSTVLHTEGLPSGELPPPIAGYRIIRKIGEGGMGSVFEAEQEHPRRRVALKLLRAAGGSRRLVQRFQQEVQILGRLQHPGIAQILEAGTFGEGADKRPYFVMELVRGASLLEYAQRQCLSRRERLALFALVCDAVHYAHQCGVVHRDLKPSNIFVSQETAAPTSEAGVERAGDRAAPLHRQTKERTRRLFDATTSAAGALGALPKILDFGVARLPDSDLAAVTQQTIAGELIGTVPYMSPEQAAGDAARLDWRSDVYSLGAVLYELLTGRLPHNVRRMMVHEAVRVIREDDPTPAGSIDRSLRGDIETILAKALEKDHLRRYQSAADLAADIRRYLSEQPIAARPASALYRIAKFTRRNTAVVAGVLVAFLALTVGAGVALRQAFVAEQARAEERRLRGEAERQSYAANLTAASAALRRHEISQALRHLEAAPSALRGWEWDHLRSRLDDSLAVRQAGFNPYCFALSPDGETLAACSSGGRIVAWNVADWSRRAEHRLTGSVAQRRIERLTYSADGAILRADTRVASVNLDALTLQLVSRDDGPQFCRSADGRFVIRFDKPESPTALLVEEGPTGRERFRVAGQALHDALVRFSRDGRLLAVHCPAGEGLRIFRCPDGAALWQRGELGTVADIRFDGDGSRLGVAMASGEAFIVRATDGSTLASLRGHETSARAIDFSPDGLRVATASSDGTVRFWDAASGAPLYALNGLRAQLHGAAFTADGRRFVTASADVGLQWWDATLSVPPFVIQAPGTVYGLAYSPDGSLLAAACLGGESPLRIWETAAGSERFTGLDGHLSALAFDRDGRRIAVGRSTRLAQTVVVSIAGELLASLRGNDWRTDWVGFGRGDQDVLSLGNDGLLSLFDAARGERTRRASFAGNENAHGCRAAISPNGSILAVACKTELRLLDADTWAPIASLAGHTEAIYALAFSADGTRLVSGGRDRTLRVWDVRTHASVAVMTGHTDEIFAAAISPDGKRIVSGGRDRVIRVWDGESFEEITQLHGHTSFVYCLAFHPGGRTLATGGGDATVRLWETRSRRQLYERSTGAVGD